MGSILDKCIVCGKQSVKDNKCKKHYIEYKLNLFADNRDIKSYKETGKGVLAFLRYFYKEHYRNEFSKEHIEVYQMLLDLYDNRYTKKEHRLRELIAFRGFSKSKIIFGMVSYQIAMNNRKIWIKCLDGIEKEIEVMERLIVIFSETATMSEEFVSNVRDEFTINRLLTYFFKYKIVDALDSLTGQWTKKAFKINDTYILGLGQGQQVRGKIKNAWRPTSAYIDDIYSENNTTTKLGRIKIKNWFNNALINSIDDLVGKAFLVGTIVHLDSVLISCELSDTWISKKYYPMDILDFKRILKKHIKIDSSRNSCKLPFDTVSNIYDKISKQENFFLKLEEEYKVCWPERLGIYAICLKYKKAVEEDSVSGFYQEYFHEVIPTELKKFKEGYFRPIPEFNITNDFGYNWINFEDKSEVINIEFGIDLASGLAEGDNVSLAITSQDAFGKIYVLKTVYGKFSLRDILITNINRADKLIMDKEYIEKVGIIDESMRLALEYHPRVIKVGVGGGMERGVLNEFIRLFRVNQIYTNILPRAQTMSDGNKVERIMDTLLPYYEAMRVYHANGLDQLEYEELFLSRAKKDDVVDSLEVAMFNIRRPTHIDISMFKKQFKRPNRLLKNINTNNTDWFVN